MILDHFEMADLAAKGNSCWILLLSDSSGEDVPVREIHQAAPYLDAPELHLLLTEDRIFLRFDTEEAAMRNFRQTVGDDGPTLLNSYDGPGRVYAYLTGPNGGITENT